MREETIEIECNNCQHVNVVYLQDLDFNVVSYERNMGAENEHYTSHETSCEKCGKNINFNYSAWEYPVGCFNTSDVDISGGELVKIFNETEMFQEKYYDLDEETGIYLPGQQDIISSLNIGIANLILSAEKDPSIISSINPREFEEFVADIFHRNGFKVEVTQKTRDGGCDIIAIRSDLNINTKFIIECKRYIQSRKIGVDIVRQLYGVQKEKRANKSILVTTSHFTKDAIDFANSHTTEWDMSLVDFQVLLNWVKKIYGNMPQF